jgi:hypothetical protein
MALTMAESMGRLRQKGAANISRLGYYAQPADEPFSQDNRRHPRRLGRRPPQPAAQPQAEHPFTEDRKDR